MHMTTASMSLTELMFRLNLPISKLGDWITPDTPGDQLVEIVLNGRPSTVTAQQIREAVGICEALAKSKKGTAYRLQ
jgi:hypothetical protein